MKAVFDDRSSAWVPQLEYNVMYVRLQQDFMNDLLKARGFVTIMEVFQYLGLKLDFEDLSSKSIDKLCWRYENGDWIDFGMKPDEEKNIIYLDFNIDID